MNEWMNEWIALKWTHSSWPWIWDAPLESHPLKVGPVSVSEGPIEDCEDVGHVVHTHGWAFEHGAEETRWILYWDNGGNLLHLDTHPAGIFYSCLSRSLFLWMCEDSFLPHWSDVVWLGRFKPHCLAHKRCFVEYGQQKHIVWSGEVITHSWGTSRTLLFGLGVFFEPGYTGWTRIWSWGNMWMECLWWCHPGLTRWTQFEMRTCRSSDQTSKFPMWCWLWPLMRVLISSI